MDTKKLEFMTENLGERLDNFIFMYEKPIFFVFDLSGENFEFSSQKSEIELEIIHFFENAKTTSIVKIDDVAVLETNKQYANIKVNIERGRHKISATLGTFDVVRIKISGVGLAKL